MPYLDSTPLVPLLTTKASPSLSFQLISDIVQLRALAPDWQRLLDQSVNAEPMRSPAWLLTWWDVYAAHRALRVGVFRDGDQLVGLALLCSRRHWHRSWLPFHRLEFLGADTDEQDGVCSEYLGLIARAEHEQILTNQFVQEIDRGSFGGCHEVVLSALNGADAMTGMLEAAFQAAGDAVERDTVTTAPYLSLPHSWDEYLKCLDKKKRYNLTRALRDFEAWAGAEWQIEAARTPDELARGQSILRALHNQRWEADEHSAGAYASPRFTAFHDAYMPRLLSDEKLDLFWLTVRGEPVAVHYQILANGKAYFYQCGRSLKVPANIRIGIVMVALAIQRAIRSRLREFDFLGGPAQYKLQFTQTTRPIVKLRIAQPGLRESLRRGTERLIDCARVIRHRYRAWRKPGAPSDVNES